GAAGGRRVRSQGQADLARTGRAHEAERHVVRLGQAIGQARLVRVFVQEPVVARDGHGRAVRLQRGDAGRAGAQGGGKGGHEGEGGGGRPAGGAHPRPYPVHSSAKRRSLDRFARSISTALVWSPRERVSRPEARKAAKTGWSARRVASSRPRRARASTSAEAAPERMTAKPSAPGASWKASRTTLEPGAHSSVVRRRGVSGISLARTRGPSPL